MTDNILIAVIVGCEIAFWLFLLSGLLVRYLFDLKRLSSALLICVPLVDVVLLAATTIDLSRGAVATYAHGLAAAYIGFSVAFGSVTIGWVDAWFAYKYAGAKRPASAPTHGWKLIRSEIFWWLRCVLAVAVTQTLVYAAIFFVDDPHRTEQLNLWLKIPLFTVVLWFIFGPLWVILFHRTAPKEI